MPSAWSASAVPILFRPVYTDTGSSTELLFAHFSPFMITIRGLYSFGFSREYAADLKA